MSDYKDLLVRLEERKVEHRWTDEHYHDPHATVPIDLGPVNRDGAEAARTIRALQAKVNLLEHELNLAIARA